MKKRISSAGDFYANFHISKACILQCIKASSGVHSHIQQHPLEVLCFGKPKVSPKNFQSPLTSTNTDLAPNEIPFFFLLQRSDFLQAVLSCRACGAVPKKHHCKLQLTISMMSVHVLAPICFRDMAVIGSRKVWYGSLTPGRFRLKVSTDSVLSQLHGTPSPHNPRATNLSPARASISSK